MNDQGHTVYWRPASCQGVEDIMSWPSVCQICGRWPSHPLCSACRERFAGARLKADAVPLPPAPDIGTCDAIQTRQITCAVAVEYGFPWDRLIARFKFEGECGMASALAELMLCATGMDELAASCDVVVPIPLHPVRLAERGYNQAWELARYLCRYHPELQGKGQPAALQRHGVRANQHTLGRAQRLRNLREAFVVAPAMRSRVHGASVLLVDDVYTTGATLHAAAGALLKAGARSVSASVFARTPPPPHERA